jgi:hypothetical protein
MDNEFDPYLSRSLKNWVNNHPPAMRGKERLLRAAADLPRQYSKGSNSSSTHRITFVMSTPFTPWSLHPAFLCAARSLWPWPGRLA